MGSRLRRLDSPERLLATSILLVLAAGFVVSEVYVALTLSASGIDIVGFRAIVATYHGDRSTTRLKKKALGSMQRYFSAFEDPRRLAPDEQADLDRIVSWSDAGAAEAEYWNPIARRSSPGPILSVLRRRGCLDCHSPTATTIGHKRDSPLDTYAAIRRFTQPDQGMDPARLLLISHVHLLGMGMLFLLSGAAVVATRWPPRLRAALAVSGPLSVLATTGGFWAVKYGGPPFALLVLIGGVGMAFAFLGSVLAALLDLWLPQGAEASSTPTNE
jgi:hypothetical protein